MKPAALRAAARIAWRDAVRNRWRSLLVLAMIALPIAGLTVAGIVLDTTTPTDAEVATGEMGTADVGIYDWDDSLTIQDVLDGLPDGISAVRRSWDTRILAEGSIQYVTVEDVAPTDEVVGAIYRLTGGRAPVSQGEIAVSPAILEGFALGIGDDISLGDIGNTYRVVGTVVKPEHLGKGVAVVAPGSLDAQPGARLDAVGDKGPEHDGRGSRPGNTQREQGHKRPGAGRIVSGFGGRQSAETSLSELFPLFGRRKVALHPIGRPFRLCAPGLLQRRIKLIGAGLCLGRWQRSGMVQR